LPSGALSLYEVGMEFNTRPGRRSTLERFRPELYDLLRTLLDRARGPEAAAPGSPAGKRDPRWENALNAARALAGRVYVDGEDADRAFAACAEVSTQVYVERLRLGWALWHAAHPILLTEGKYGTFTRTPVGDLLEPGLGPAVRETFRLPGLIPWQVVHLSLNTAWHPQAMESPSGWALRRIAAWGWGEAPSQRHARGGITLRNYAPLPLMPAHPMTPRPMALAVWLDLATRPAEEDASAPRSGLPTSFFDATEPAPDGLPQWLTVSVFAQPVHLKDCASGGDLKALAAEQRRARLLTLPIREQHVGFMSPEAPKWVVRVDLRERAPTFSPLTYSPLPLSDGNSGMPGASAPTVKDQPFDVPEVPGT
jgi:hypothetical protein